MRSDKQVFFADCVFRVAENVYEPAEDSFLFAENLKVREGDRVVDIGTGCGILGIVAAAKADEVLAIDISPHAVRCARGNAELNHMAHKIFFIQGDLFGPARAGESFDLVLFNAPYLPSEEQEEDSWLGWTWNGGKTGRDVIDQFVDAVPRYLTQEGRVLLMQSTLSDVERTLTQFRQKNLKAEVVADRDLPFFETIVLVAAERF